MLFTNWRTLSINFSEIFLLACMTVRLPAVPIDLGIDATVDASAGLGGQGSGHRALNAILVPHMGWSQSEDAQRPVVISGYVSALGVLGHGPTDRFLFDSLGAVNTEAFPGARLYSWWLEGKAGAWSLRTGALLADEEFAGTRPGSVFINSAFGWPAFVSANTRNTGPAYFIPALGARLAWESEQGLGIKLGVYDGDSFDSPTGDAARNRSGTHYQLNRDQGAFLMSEVTLAPKDSPMSFKVGGWYHTARFDDTWADDTGASAVLSGNPVRQVRGNYGGYAIVERTLAGEEGKPGHVAVHVRGGVAPADRNALSWGIDTAIAWTGPLAGRPEDVVAFGLAHVGASSHVARAAREAGDPKPDFEQVWETSYQLKLFDPATLQFGLQYIRHPGGDDSQDDAWLGLLRLMLSY